MLRRWPHPVRLLAAFAVSLGMLCAPARAFEQPESATGFVPKPLVTAKRQMVVAAHPLAAEAGLAMLRKGGSAVDAGIAVQMVLNVVEPQSSGIGGGAFILYWDQANKTLTSIDGRETAPAAATPELFLDRQGKPLPRAKVKASGRAVGVPGVLAALAQAHASRGKLLWADLFAPAIAIARDGFAVPPRLGSQLAELGPQSFSPEAQALFFDKAGRPWPTGYKLRNPVLADTLEVIARDGADRFYAGEIAGDIVKAVTSDPRGAGKLALSDFKDYRAKERAPLCSPYRAYEVCGMGPPSSGGVAVAQTLGIVAPFNLGIKPFQVEPTHLIAEAERLAYADRARYLADSDFRSVPLAGLLDPKYLAERRALINPARAMQTVVAGTPPNIREGAFGKDATQESAGTSHISIVDAVGNAFSMTTSIEQGFGARLMVRGFLLNNQLTDFSFEPADAEGRPIANRVEGGKRPRSTMDPTIVFAKDRKLRFLLGSPGGPAIALVNLKAILALIDWNENAADAAALANFGAPGDVFLLEPGVELDALAKAMQQLGHNVKRAELSSGLHIIAMTPDGLQGGADPRRDGVAVGD